MRKRTPERSLADLAEQLVAAPDPDERRAARLAMREELLAARLDARRELEGSRPGDALARFGGGSLLTATILLLLGGRIGWPVLVTAAMTLLIFVGGTIYWRYAARRALMLDHRAERLEAVLKETER